LKTRVQRSFGTTGFTLDSSPPSSSYRRTRDYDFNDFESTTNPPSLKIADFRSIGASSSSSSSQSPLGLDGIVLTETDANRDKVVLLGNNGSPNQLVSDSDPPAISDSDLMPLGGYGEFGSGNQSDFDLLSRLVPAFGFELSEEEEEEEEEE
jgi:hypothetical protein